MIRDPDVQVLASLAAGLRAEYTEQDVPWATSPFAWIKTRPSRQIGTIGEKLLAGFLATKGFNIARSPDSEADRVVEGKRVEVKFSTLWAGGTYRFQQLRDQRYDLVVCLGISPFDAYCWTIPKDEVMRRWEENDGIVSQHGGIAGSDTAWMQVSPTAPFPWLTRWGGTLAGAVGVLSDMTGFRPPPVASEEE